MQINNSSITNNTTNGGASNQKTGGSAKLAGTSEGTSNTTASSVPKSNDSIELSQAAKVMTDLEAKIASASDVDAGRVESIKQAINNGAYSIDTDSIASKIVSIDGFF
jgi:negative regulator of flagellin synthesis FlgM